MRELTTTDIISHYGLVVKPNGYAVLPKKLFQLESLTVQIAQMTRYMAVCGRSGITLMKVGKKPGLYITTEDEYLQVLKATRIHRELTQEEGAVDSKSCSGIMRHLFKFLELESPTLRNRESYAPSWHFQACDVGIHNEKIMLDINSAYMSSARLIKNPCFFEAGGKYVKIRDGSFEWSLLLDQIAKEKTLRNRLFGTMAGSREGNEEGFAPLCAMKKNDGTIATWNLPPARGINELAGRSIIQYIAETTHCMYKETNAVYCNIDCVVVDYECTKMVESIAERKNLTVGCRAFGSTEIGGIGAWHIGEAMSGKFNNQHDFISFCTYYKQGKRLQLFAL